MINFSMEARRRIQMQVALERGFLDETEQLGCSIEDLAHHFLHSEGAIPPLPILRDISERLRVSAFRRAQIYDNNVPRDFHGWWANRSYVVIWRQSVARLAMLDQERQERVAARERMEAEQNDQFWEELTGVLPVLFEDVSPEYSDDDMYMSDIESADSVDDDDVGFNFERYMRYERRHPTFFNPDHLFNEMVALIGEVGEVGEAPLASSESDE